MGFESYIITLDDDSRVSGIISSETAEEVVLRLPGGFANCFEKSEIVAQEQINRSLIPALQSGMSEQELIELAEYLSTITY